MLKKKYVTVQVTKKDIKEGEPRDPSWCPVALALLRKGFDHPEVHDSRFEAEYSLVDGGSDFRSVPLPKLAQRFIDKFDDQDYVTPKTLKPLKFRLLLPDGVKAPVMRRTKRPKKARR